MWFPGRCDGCKAENVLTRSEIVDEGERRYVDGFVVNFNVIYVRICMICDIFFGADWVAEGNVYYAAPRPYGPPLELRMIVKGINWLLDPYVIGDVGRHGYVWGPNGPIAG